MYLGNIFLTFLINFLFLKIWHFWSKKLKFWQKSDFWGAFLVKIFKNKKFNLKSEETFPRYTYLDDFGKFLVIFVQKYFFALVKKNRAKKSLFFGDFSKIQFLAKNLTI